MAKISTSNEDYLEAMVMLGASETTPVKAVEVANKMGVSKAAIRKAVGKLKEEGLVEQPYYGEITLTKAGYSYGNKVLKRHNYLTKFLNETIGIDREIAEEEACMMEHAISDESFEKWVEYIDSLR